MNPVFAAGALIAVGAALIPVGYKYVYQPLFANSESRAISDSEGRYDLVAQQDEDEEALSIQTKVEINRSDKAYDYQPLTSEAPASHYGHFDRSKYNQTPQTPGETFLQVGGAAHAGHQKSPVHHDQVDLEDVIQQALTNQKQVSPSSPAPQKAPKINEQYLTSYQQYTPSIVSNTSVTVSSSSASSSMPFQPAPLPEEEEEEEIEVVEATIVTEVTDNEEEPNIGKFVLAAKQEQIQRAMEVSQEASVVEEIEIVEEVNLSKFQESEAQEPEASIVVQEVAVAEIVAPSESSILDKFASTNEIASEDKVEEAPAEEINLDKFSSQQSEPQPAAVEETPAVETAELVNTEASAEEVDTSKLTTQEEAEETKPAAIEESKPAEVIVEEVQVEPVDISKFSEEATASTEAAEPAPTAAEEPKEEQPAQQEAESSASNPVPSSSQQKKKKKNNKKNKKK